MSKRYPGNFITGNPVALSQTSNNGVWDLKDQYQANGNNTWQEGDGNYEIGRSLRFRSSATAFFTRTAITAGNRKTWTWSGWVKRGVLGTNQTLFDAYSGDENNNTEIYIGSDNKLSFSNVISSTQGNGFFGTTTAIFRDPSAWYHLVFSVDTTQSGVATALKVYVNGIQQEITGSYGGGANQNTWVNSATTHRLGQTAPPNSNYFNGYMTEVNFIDGQALDSSYFGYFDSITNIWYPKKYTGVYGTNGFYLPFNDTYNVYGLGNDKKETTTLSVYLGTGGIPNTASSALQGAHSKFGGTALELIGYLMPGGLGNNYGVHNPMHNLNNKDFTIEFWYKGTAAQTNFGSIDGVITGYNYFVSKGRTNTSSRGWGLHLYSNGTLSWDEYYGSGGASVSTTGHTVLDNNWHHIAVSRSSGTMRIYVDGTQRGTGSINTDTDTTYGLVINGMWDYSTGDNITYKIGGYMDDFRMYTGIAKYTSNFVAPTEPLPIGQGDQYWGYVSCAVPFDQVNSTTFIPCWIPNYWTPNNLSLTAGVTYDSMVDSPTNVFTSATDVGGVVPGNYATLSNLVPQTNSSLTDGNLQWFNQSGVGTSYAKPASFWGPGKWYFEVTVTNGSATSVMDTGAIGVMVYDPATTYASRSIGYGGADYVWRYDGNRVTGGTATSYGTAVNSNTDVVMCAYDTSNNTVWFGKNGTWFASSNPATATSPAFTDAVRDRLEYLFKPIVHSTHGGGGTAVNVVNFGQRQFAYTPPAGFKSLCTTNLQERGASFVATAALTPNKWFDTSLYGGSNADIRVQNAGFQPDFIWVKSRSNAQGHALVNSIGGGGEILQSNTASVPFSGITKPLTFNSDGFTSTTDIHTNGYGYVAWQWKQSPIAGFNIVSYTGDGTNNRAISHNLGVTPEFIIVKDRTIAYNWDIYHRDLGISATHIFTSSNTRNASAFGSTAPTSSNFFTQNSYTNSSNSRMIAYLWASVPGFSKFGSMTGNGLTDGTFVYTGFRPRFILMKGSDLNQWTIWDSSRLGYNPFQAALFPNANSAEDATASGSNSNGGPDFLSNGFKMRSNGGSNNLSGVTYIYAAFAESPFGLNNRAE